MRVKYYLMFLIIVLFILGCEQAAEQPVEEVVEEKGTGILAVNSVPSDAAVFLNNENKGNTPLTLYGVIEGTYIALIKKECFEDYETLAEVKAGKKTELDAYLNKQEVTREETEGEIVEIEVEEELIEIVVEEESSVGSLEMEGVIELGNKVVKYYDFSEREFTDRLQAHADVFSKRIYLEHLVFTRYSDVDVSVIDKNINMVNWEDCKDITGSIGFLYSGQTLCVNTKEGLNVAIGGKWEETSNVSLRWKMLD